MEERFAAPLHGKVLRASAALREGMARSLARLAQSDEALQALHGPRCGSTLANITVRALLPVAWKAWASVAPLLPWLAEAAPEAFLEAVESSLRAGGDAGVAQVLGQEDWL